MAICPNCRRNISESAKSCTLCGALFGENAWKPIPEGASEAGAANAFEHYVRLSSDDLKGLLRTGVLSDADRHFVLNELQKRGEDVESVPTSKELSDERFIKNYAMWSPFIILTMFGLRGALWLVVGCILSSYAASTFLSTTRAEAIDTKNHRFPVFLLYHSVGLILYVGMLLVFLR